MLCKQQEDMTVIRYTLHCGGCFTIAFDFIAGFSKILGLSLFFKSVEYQ